MMKKNTVATIAILSIISGGCSADKELMLESAGKTLLIAENVGVGADSRTAVDKTEYASGEMGINWMPTDRIGVFGTQGSANVMFSNTREYVSPSTVFAGNLKDGETPAYAYYPYFAGVGTDYNSLTASLPSTQVYDLATGEIEGDYKYGEPAGEDGKFAFKHMFAFLRFDISASGASVENEVLESITLSITPGNGVHLAGDFTFNCANGDATMSNTGTNEVVMKWKEQPVLSSSKITGYMSVAPVELAGKQINVKVTTNRSVSTFTVEPKADAIVRNSYYVLPLEMKVMEQLPSYKNELRDDLPQGTWVPGLNSRLACANTVFSLPNTPFMHKIRVPESDATIIVYGLPEGLTWNSRRKLVEGKVASEGEYLYTVAVTTPDGNSYTEGVKLTVSSNLQMPTPFMGWLSWNVVESNISQTVVEQVADALVSKGLAAAGYNHLVIDDFWHASSRNADGTPMWDASKFPNGIKAAADYTHSKGLKFGIYSDAGCKTCGGMFGSQGYEDKDARAYADWDVDILKYDFCFAGDCNTGGSVGVDAETAWNLYRAMGSELKDQSRSIVMYMCEWGMNEPWKWGAETGATTWRCTYDTRDGWNGQTQSEQSVGIGVKQSIEQMSDLWAYSGVNRFNDADMMCVGIHGTGKSSNELVDFSQSSGPSWNKKNLGMYDEEYQTQFAMWCMWSSPLTLSFDVRNAISDFDLKMMTNEELIAINQDAMGQQAELIKKENNLWYYCKDLANGDVAIAVVNMNDSGSANYSITPGDYDALDAGASYSSRDLINKTNGNAVTADAPITGTLKRHATVVYRLSKN